MSSEIGFNLSPSKKPTGFEQYEFEQFSKKIDSLISDMLLVQRHKELKVSQ